jgi:hypothetical protein
MPEMVKVFRLGCRGAAVKVLGWFSELDRGTRHGEQWHTGAAAEVLWRLQW